LTESHSHDWTSGDIKMVLKAAATERVLPAFYFTRGETGFGTTVLLTNPNVLEFSLPTGYYGSSERYIYIRVFPKDAAPPTNRAAGVGTGFFVAPDLVVTNAHVVGAGRAATVRFGGASAGATVLLKDQTNDLALVRVDGGQTAASPTPATSCLQLGDADLVKGGDRVFVIGYPLSDLLGTASSITEGLVTRVAGAQDGPRVLQISAPVQPGSSGSPVFDAQGRVIGVVTSILVSSGSRALPQNVNFAVKVSYLKPLMALVPESTCTSLVTGTTAPLSARDVQERFGTAVVQIEAMP
jgi:S1-C subfamily serine protease